MRWDPAFVPIQGNVTGRPWTETADFHRELVAGGWSDQLPMLNLVEHIATSRYALGLYGATSMSDLLVAQTAVFSMDREALRIVCDGKQFTFSHLEGPHVQPWHAQYPVDDGVRAFDHFVVELKHWYPPAP